MEKPCLRKKYSACRGALNDDTRRVFSHEILSYIKKLPAFLEAKAIMTFVSFENEVDTMALITLSFAMNKRVFVPYCFENSSDMVPCEIGSLDELTVGKHGILAPSYSAEKVISKNNLNLIFVPALAFDRYGYRLGYGGGYYDKFLDNISQDVLTIGLGFHCQVAKSLPVEKHDKKLSMLITEQGVLRF